MTEKVNSLTNLQILSASYVSIVIACHRKLRRLSSLTLQRNEVVLESNRKYIPLYRGRSNWSRHHKSPPPLFGVTKKLKCNKLDTKSIHHAHCLKHLMAKNQELMNILSLTTLKQRWFHLLKYLTTLPIIQYQNNLTHNLCTRSLCKNHYGFT